MVDEAEPDKALEYVDLEESGILEDWQMLVKVDNMQNNEDSQLDNEELLKIAQLED
ncbi:hypothetical protein EI94DRAFT_1794180 [Lactarius quietus]|nr:hypothetical protein EI94DRAFT_1794180 [Lactarius quietus]